MYKDLHIHIDSNLAKQVEDISKSNHTKLCEEYERLLNYGLSYEEKFKEINNILLSVNKGNLEINYIKFLLEQLYADIGMPQTHPELNNNLKKFKEKYRKSRKNIID